MRESASPPRTPTPRSEQLATSPVSTSYSSSSETINDSNKMHVQSSSLSTSPSIETPSVIVTSQHSQQQQQQQIHPSNENMNYGVVCNQSQLDLDFPKLTPPKSSKCPRNRDQSQSSDKSQQQQQLNSNDYNNKVAFNNLTGGNSVSATLVESITVSSNTCNKNGNKMNDNNMNITKSSSSSSSSSNGQQTMNNHIQNVAQISHQNWNRQNSPSVEHQQQQMIGGNNSISSNNNNNNSSSSNSNTNNSPPLMMNIDKENRCCPRIESQNSSNSGTFSLDENQSESPTDGSKMNERLNNKKHKSGANSKNSKGRLKNMGSSSSVEGGNSTSGFISRGKILYKTK